jgi:hypothetical protein
MSAVVLYSISRFNFSPPFLQAEQEGILNVCIINRHATLPFDVKFDFAAEHGQVSNQVEAFELHREDLGAISSRDDKEKVKTVRTVEAFDGVVTVG